MLSSLFPVPCPSITVLCQYVIYIGRLVSLSSSYVMTVIDELTSGAWERTSACWLLHVSSLSNYIPRTIWTSTVIYCANFISDRFKLQLCYNNRGVQSRCCKLNIINRLEAHHLCEGTLKWAKKTWQRAIEKIFFIIRHGNYVGAIDRDVCLY